MELQVIDAQGKSSATVSASDEVFGREYNEALVHQVVIAYQANGRSADRAQKTRAEVHHSTKKPWKQKGTGNARAGMTSSPIWRGGGRAFPNKPDENFSHKVNRKMYRAGMAAILSQLVRENRLHVVESFAVDAPKTKLVAGALKNMGLNDTLIVTDSVDNNLFLAARNLPHLSVLAAHNVDPVSLLAYNRVLLTKAAIAKIEESYK
ncbi:MAG TPA: 50S ribosomal protein L4 [Casimicrobium sp.]|jgi:large subunit ribosomal protein L4|nr:50S ribosomal protein L4 [Casimicrobium sp.]HPG62064.1 50S ribosomal protein L4 [Casimicrobium sp.]HPT55875.1 50S ribosomal protein L4 [Casimicrobium sp.]HPV23887.1 50S ribosomal protein L4 [Casimicrobium sp.]